MNIWIFLTQACGVFLAQIRAKPQVIHANAAANAASYPATLAPGAIATLIGMALAVSQTSESGTPLPDQLSDLQVLVNAIAALNFQVPFEGMPGPGEIQVASGAGTTTLQAQVAPRIFTLNSQGTGAGAIEHSISYELVTETNPAGADEIISIYSTGLGAVSPAAVSGAAAPAPPPQTIARVRVTIAGVRQQSCARV